MPVRRIPLGTRSTTGVLASDKLGRGAAYESSLERDLFTLLEFDVGVDRYEEQPVRIAYAAANGQVRNYTPDLLVWYRRDIAPGAWTPPLLCEVKYAADLDADWRRLRRRFAAARLYAAQRGWRFSVLTEREIRTPYLANARFLLPYRRQPRQPTTEQRLLDALGELREADAETLLAALYRDPGGRSVALPALWALVGWREVLCDLTRALTMRTRLWSARACPALAAPPVPSPRRTR